jgi:single-strand DNA-binding protein
MHGTRTRLLDRHHCVARHTCLCNDKKGQKQLRTFNEVTLIGYLGGDPEMVFTAKGTAVTRFSVATSRRWQQDGEWKEDTTWFRVTAWAGRGEYANKVLQKGDPVYVTGYIRTDRYVDREGVERSSWELVAQDINPLFSTSTPSDDPEADAVAAANAPKVPKNGKKNVPQPVGDITDENMPF